MPIEVPSWPSDEPTKLLSPKDRRKLIEKYRDLQGQLRRMQQDAQETPDVRKVVGIQNQMNRVLGQLGAGGVTRQELALAGIADFDIPDRYTLHHTDIPNPPFEIQQMQGPGPPPKAGFRHIFSGCDIRAVISSGSDVVDIGNLSTLSYSIHRDKPPVRVLGRSYPKSYARSGRTLAGTLIWGILDTAALSDLMDMYGFEAPFDTSSQTFVPDQLPPFDITIAYMSEVDDMSGIPTQAFMKIMGVEIVDEGQSHGIDDLYFENVMQFVARDIAHMKPARGYDPTLKRFVNMDPFNKATFQAVTEGGQKFSTWDVALRDLGTQRQGIVSALSFLASEMDRLFKQTGTFRKSWNEDIDDAYDRTISLTAELRSIDKQIEEAQGKLNENKSYYRRRSITDPTSSFTDNPYDNVQSLQ